MTNLLRLALAALLCISLHAAAQDPKPEHDGHCALSASLGNQLPTDCSVVWISPKTGKLYCFSSEKAKQTFMRDAADNEKLAQACWQDPAFWEKLIEERDAGKDN